MYDGGGGASGGALSRCISGEPACCSAQAGHPSPATKGASGLVVPWLERREPDDVVDHAELATELRDVTPQHPALRVADERDARGAGAHHHLVDERRQLVGRPVDRRHPAAHEVEREHAVAPLRERGGEQVPRHRHVPERAVHEDHGGGVRGRAAGEVVGAGRRDAGRLGGGRRRGGQQAGGGDQHRECAPGHPGAQPLTPEPAVRKLRAGTRVPSPNRSGSASPAAIAAATRSAIAGPCLKP